MPVLRLGELLLCIPVYTHDQKERTMHAAKTAFADLNGDRRLVTLPEAARFLSVGRGRSTTCSPQAIWPRSTSAARAVSRWARSGVTFVSVSKAIGEPSSRPTLAECASPLFEHRAAPSVMSQK